MWRRGWRDIAAGSKERGVARATHYQAHLKRMGEGEEGRWGGAVFKRRLRVLPLSPSPTLLLFFLRQHGLLSRVGAARIDVGPEAGGRIEQRVGLVVDFKLAAGVGDIVADDD